MSTEGKTLFQEKAEAYQKGQDRTKEAGIKTGLSVLGGSVIGLIVAAILDFVIREVTGYTLCILPIAEIACAIGIPVGLIWTLVNLVRPTKVVTCPKCGIEHRIYKSVRKYMCTNCRALLLLGKDARMMPRLSACPYCGLQTAVTDDYGRFICPNCGVVREPAGTEGWVKTQTCSECKEAVPEGAIYCKSCGSILKSDFSQPAQGDSALAYDQDWKIGKDAAGHLYFAKALLKGIRKDLVKADDIEKVQSLMTKLGDALTSAEEAWQESELRLSVEATLPEIDLTYAGLLEVELHSIQTLDPKKMLAKDALSGVATEPHVIARRRIEEILADSLVPSGGIGKWGEKLVDVEQAEKYSRVTGYEKLKNEVARFAAWMEQQTMEAMTLASGA